MKNIADDTIPTKTLGDFKIRLQEYFKNDEWDELNNILSQEKPSVRALYFSVIWNEGDAVSKKFIDRASKSALKDPRDWILGTPAPFIRLLLPKVDNREVVQAMIKKHMLLHLDKMMDALDYSAREYVVKDPYVKQSLQKYHILKNISHFKKVTDEKKELSGSVEAIKQFRSPSKTKM